MSVEKKVQSLYKRWLRPVITKPMQQQKIKMIWFVWGYWSLLFVRSLPIYKRVEFLYKFVRIDWEIEHSHKPDEIIEVIKFIAKRPAYKNEIILEAGCWKGGSSAKLSIACEFFGYKLYVFDSFEGVEPVQQDGYDYSGTYVATEEEVKKNLLSYGVEEVCVLHKGWFYETIKQSMDSPIRTVLIDCDLAKGTEEVLESVLPWLVNDGAIFTQDYHISSVKELLADSTTWEKLKVSQPIIEPLCHHLAIMKFHDKPPF